MARKNWEKHNKPFAEALHALAVELGAVPNNAYLCTMYPLALETCVGTLLLHAAPNSAQPGACLYGRFLDVARAREAGYASNHYTGKWNHHYFTTDINEALSLLRHVLESVRDHGERGDNP